MVPVKTNSNWLPSIFNDFFENEWLAKTGVTAPARCKAGQAFPVRRAVRPLTGTSGTGNRHNR